MDEFEIIRKHFQGLTKPRSDISVGIGDDAALLQPMPGHELVVTTDTLVADHHFFWDADAYGIGWKSLAVSLSDLAAMGAQPQWCVLSVTLPEANASWLKDFARGFKDLADQHDIALVGGDTTHGPMSITVTAFGSVQAGTAMRRKGAKVGDLICVTGTLGDAALALRMTQLKRNSDQEQGLRKFFRRRSDALDRLEQGFTLNKDPTEADAAALYERLNRPVPRVAAGLVLRDVSHAAIDLSDGIAGDLQHILEASGVGADVWMDRLPASEAFMRVAPPAFRFQLQLSGGDDYELCVCLPADEASEIRRSLGVLPFSIIGRVIEKPGLNYKGANGSTIPLKLKGFRHFP